MSAGPSPEFWRGRDVLLTGHTGFKGGWLTLMLSALGARVHGFALAPETATFDSLGAAEHLASDTRGDLADRAALACAVRQSRPDVVLHLAAEAIVGRSYRDPARTYARNVTGTVNLLEATRAGRPGLPAVLVVTSDKVYRNDGSGRPMKEDDPLGGADPYSASKAACEHVARSYAASFAADLPGLATARAGNVIGGGDFGEDRLIPDLVRAEAAGAPLVIRNPDSTRPFQHVLDVLRGYLLFAEALAGRPRETPAALNFGPDDGARSVRQVLEAVDRVRGKAVDWTHADPRKSYAEAPQLALDASLARETLGWAPSLRGDAVFAVTMDWYGGWMAGDDMRAPSMRAARAALS